VNVIPLFVATGVISYYSIKADWISSVCILGWAVVATLVGQFLLNRVAKTTFVLSMKEGAFRYLHGRIRTFSESVAFYRGEPKEESDTNKAFAEVYESY
jgi:ABC-type uncharacterized transport system fused permease/ATPase subunit